MSHQTSTTPQIIRPRSSTSFIGRANLIPWGQELYAYSKVSLPTDAKTACVFDIGSGSSKGIVYNCTLPIPQPVDDGDFKKECSLGQGMKPYDEHARLNRDALRIYYDEVLPEGKKLIRKHKPDAILVLCTQAVWAANQNPNESSIVKDLIQNTADTFGIEPRAVNIVSRELEAHLAALGVLVGQEHADGYSDTIGGNSRELACFENGKIILSKLATLQIGRNTLTPLSEKARIDLIRTENRSVDWFNAPRSSMLSLQGNAFRMAGRIAAQRLERISFRSKFPFDGHTFINDEQYIRELKRMKTETIDDVRDDFLRFECGQQLGIKNYHDISERSYDRWLEERPKGAQKAWDEKFDKRIGSKFDCLPATIDVIIDDIKCVHPRTINHGMYSIREGALRYAGIGL